MYLLLMDPVKTIETNMVLKDDNQLHALTSFYEMKAEVYLHLKREFELQSVHKCIYRKDVIPENVFLSLCVLLCRACPVVK